jgi:hypothetical protein
LRRFERLPAAHTREAQHGLAPMEAQHGPITAGYGIPRLDYGMATAAVYGPIAACVRLFTVIHPGASRPARIRQGDVPKLGVDRGVCPNSESPGGCAQTRSRQGGVPKLGVDRGVYPNSESPGGCAPARSRQGGVTQLGLLRGYSSSWEEYPGCTPPAGSTQGWLLQRPELPRGVSCGALREKMAFVGYLGALAIARGKPTVAKIAPRSESLFPCRDRCWSPFGLAARSRERAEVSFLVPKPSLGQTRRRRRPTLYEVPSVSLGASGA